MKILAHLTILSTFCFLSCSGNKFNIELDEKETILLNTDYNQWLNEEYGYQSWEPEQEDFNTLKLIIDKAIDSNQFDFIGNPVKDNYTKYYRQYIPYINKQNERIMKINAFCKILNLPPASSKSKNEFKKMNWKNHYVAVEDGGNCFWEIRVNIDHRRIISL